MADRASALRAAEARARFLLLSSERVYRLGRRGLVLGRYLTRQPHEPDFAGFRHLHMPDGLFLDVGANAGQSALSFRLYRPHAPILSVEANDYHERDLRFLKRVLRNFDYLICAAGEANTETTLHIPMFRGVPITGEASIYQHAAEESWWLHSHAGASSLEDFRVEEKRVTVRRLDDMKLAPAFVKVDVEGAELAALRGLAGTLERHRPVVLSERSSSFPALQEFLAQLGYEPRVYLPGKGRFERFDGQYAQNVFFLP